MRVGKEIVGRRDSINLEPFRSVLSASFIITPPFKWQVKTMF